MTPGFEAFFAVVRTEDEPAAQIAEETALSLSLSLRLQLSREGELFLYCAYQFPVFFP